MKRIFLPIMISLAFFTAPTLRAQDAAIDERLNQLSGKVEDLVASNAKLQKQLDSLGKEVQELRTQQNHPAGNYAAQEDLKALAEKVQQIDQNRQKDKQLILEKLDGLGKAISAPARPTKNPGAVPPKETSSAPDKTGTSDQKGFEYMIQENDSLLKIVKAYKAQNIKVTVEQIQKANPGLEPTKMVVGQKIFIPAPQQ